MAVDGSKARWAVTLVDGSQWRGRRAHRRKPVMWAAQLETESGTFDCSAFDLSLGGAKLRLREPVMLRRPVRLVLKRFGTLEAEAVWRRAGTVGLRFAEPAEIVARIFGGTLPL